MAKLRFSFFRAPIFNKYPTRDISVREAHELIVGETLAVETATLRGIADIENRNKYKSKHLCYITPSGVFSERKANKLIDHSGLLVVDLDHLPVVEETFHLLIKDPCIETELLFRSPSGDGLKWIVTIDESLDSHENWFEAIVRYLSHSYGLTPDRSGKDVSRACYLCHDPKAYLNPWYADPSQPRESKRFSMEQWGSPKVENQSRIGTGCTSNKTKEVEEAIQQLEALRLDITPTYEIWRNIGFSFAHEFGENGRTFFHRVSQFHPEYHPHECDRQYSAIMKSPPTDIHIETFFHHFHQGLQHSSTPPDELPQFPSSIYEGLPMLLIQATAPATSPQERDLLLLSSLVTISGCLPNVFGTYDGMCDVAPNLYLFVVAKAASGKGRMALARELAQPIHKILLQEAKSERERYNRQLASFNKGNTLEYPSLPKQRMLIFPGNNTASGIAALLSDNNGLGLIFETECDTLSQSFKKEHGNFSDILRKSYDHDMISQFRKTHSEFVEVPHPCLTLVVSGTPGQLITITSGVDNGLCSRFLYYHLTLHQDWRDVFAHSGEESLNKHFEGIGNELLSYFKRLKKGSKMEFILSPVHKEAFNAYFRTLSKKWEYGENADLRQMVNRLGLMGYRIAMTLTALRQMDAPSLPHSLNCHNEDLERTLRMLDVLTEHSLRTFQLLNHKEQKRYSTHLKNKFFEALPFEFTRKDFLAIADSLSIPQGTADLYISNFLKDQLLVRLKKGIYQRC